MKFIFFIKIFKAAFIHWWEKRGPNMGAALAYYSAFSLAPLLLIGIALSTFFYSEAAVRDAIVNELNSLMGELGATAVREMLLSTHRESGGVWASLIGFGALLVGAATVFGELQSSLDTIWEVPTNKTAGGWLVFIRKRFLSFGLVLAVGFLLLVSLFVSSAIAAFVKYYSALLQGEEIILYVLNILFSLSVLTVLFALIYKWLPTLKVAWRHVWVGSFITAILFSLGQFTIGLYLGHSAIASTYGAAGAFVVLLVWLYYSAQIFLYGAAVTFMLSKGFKRLFS